MKRNLTKRQRLTRQIYEDAKQAIAGANWRASLACNRAHAQEQLYKKQKQKNEELLAVNITKQPWENYFRVCINVDYKTFVANQHAFESHVTQDIINSLIDFMRRGPQ